MLVFASVFVFVFISVCYLYFDLYCDLYLYLYYVVCADFFGRVGGCLQDWRIECLCLHLYLYLLIFLAGGWVDVCRTGALNASPT